MSDDVKDFAYYADAAERILSGITEDMPVLDVAAVAACAQVFATLAAGAPAAPLPGVCPCRLFPIPPNGDFEICILGAGHNGDHLTGGGVYFQD